MGNAPCHGDGAIWVKFGGLSNCFSPPSAGLPVLDSQLFSQLFRHLQHPHLTRAGYSRVWKEHSEPCWEKQEPGQSWEGFPTTWGWDQVSSTMTALGSQGQPELCHCTPSMGSSSIFLPLSCGLELIADLCALCSTNSQISPAPHLLSVCLGRARAWDTSSALWGQMLLLSCRFLV